MENLDNKPRALVGGLGVAPGHLGDRGGQEQVVGVVDGAVEGDDVDLELVDPVEGGRRDRDARLQLLAALLLPIVVDAESVIIVGHTRYKAAQKLGLKQVPVHVARDLSPEKIKAYRIADNQTATLAEWNYDLLPIEIKDLQAMAEMKGQEARLNNLSLQLFGGFLRTQGTLGLGTPAPPFSGKVSLQGLQLGPALQAVGTDQVSISGTAGAELALTGRGFTQPDLVKALAGTGRVAVKDGKIEGINLLQEAATLLKVVGVSLENVKTTAFSTIESEFAI